MYSTYAATYKLGKGDAEHVLYRTKLLYYSEKEGVADLKSLQGSALVSVRGLGKRVVLCHTGFLVCLLSGVTAFPWVDKLRVLVLTD